MAPVPLNVQYRPVRLGFCVRDGDLDGAKRAMEWAHGIWGGRFCPIIPIGDDTRADPWIRGFPLDLLFPIVADEDSKRFIARWPQLQWPFAGRGFWVPGMRGKSAQFLTVAHPLRQIASRAGRDLDIPSPLLMRWQENDPLALWMLALTGAFPIDAEETLPPYERQFQTVLNATTLNLQNGAALPTNLLECFTLNTLTEFDVAVEHPPMFPPQDGIYVSSGCTFDDIVAFWNLRARGHNLLFYDVQHGERLDAAVEAFFRAPTPWRRSPSQLPRMVALFTSDEALLDREIFRELPRCIVPEEWVHLPAAGKVRFGLRSRSVLATIHDDAVPPTIFLPLPDKPFSTELGFHSQHVMVTVSSHETSIFPAADYIFPPPPLPSLSAYYGRELARSPWKVRVDASGASFMARATEEHLRLQALNTPEVFTQFFEALGIEAKRSKPGLIAHRLIKQMGGLQDCRIFKLPGVRQLIRKYRPGESFVYSEAIQLIRSGIERHEQLVLEPRKHQKLKSDEVFQFLLKKGVFRAGLELRCPNCELEFWRHVDDCKTMLPCEFCGEPFNITPQLKHRGDWRFRRSGLFGSDDHQGGSVPVALTLQQLETAFSAYPLIHCTALELTPNSADIAPCETDFVVLHKNADDRVQIALSECKGNEEISEADVANLSRVARCIASAEIEAFVIFSKLGPFSPAEIQRIRSVEPWPTGGFILFSARELEPYFLYADSPGAQEACLAASDFREMVSVTDLIYPPAAAS